MTAISKSTELFISDVVKSTEPARTTSSEIELDEAIKETKLTFYLHCLKKSHEYGFIKPTPCFVVYLLGGKTKHVLVLSSSNYRQLLVAELSDKQILKHRERIEKLSIQQLLSYHRASKNILVTVQERIKAHANIRNQK